MTTALHPTEILSETFSINPPDSLLYPFSSYSVSGQRNSYGGGGIWEQSETMVRGTMAMVFEIGDLLRLIHGRYDIRVNVTDINGNWETGKTSLNNLIGLQEKKIGIIGYYFGIVLAFTGFLAGAATGVLEGKLLKYATFVALATSVIGLVWSLYLLKRDAEVESSELAAPELKAIEIAIGACGVVTASINVFDKWGE